MRKPKHLVMVTQWFPPEHAPIGHMFLELAEDLISVGWKVTVITGVPNHPTGKVSPGFRKALWQWDKSYSPNVLRVWLHTSPNRSRLNRLLTFASFSVTSFFATLLMRPCVLFAVLQPLSVGPCLVAASWLTRAKLVFNVQDLHPNVPIELGLVRNRFAIKALKGIERFSYKNADKVAAICDGFAAHVTNVSDDPHRSEVIPNWFDASSFDQPHGPNKIRVDAGIPENAFVVLYAGTIGYVSGAHVVIEAARLTANQDKSVYWLFVGEGPLLHDLKVTAATHALTNVCFLPFQPREMLSLVQFAADVSLVTLLPGKGHLSVPSKVLGYMAAARPVVACVDTNSETARLVAASGCGVVTPPDDPYALCKQVEIFAASPSLRKQHGQSGNAYLRKELSRHAVTAKYASLLEAVNAGRATAT
jgi:colanic acid biosynthesis glycosyl transferase WcaI